MIITIYELKLGHQEGTGGTVSPDLGSRGPRKGSKNNKLL